MIQRILVAVDDSEASLAAVDQAIRLARSCYAQVRLLHLLVGTRPAPDAGDDSPADVFGPARERGRMVLDHCRSRVSAAGVAVDSLLVEGSGNGVAQVVADKARAWHADLIVMGTRGRSGIELLVQEGDERSIARTPQLPVTTVCARPRSADADRVRLHTLQPLAAFAVR